MDVNRRNLIAGGVSLALADLLPGAARASEKGTEVKFCVFADLHYAPRVFPNDTPEFLEKILKRAEDNNVDFVLHLGDFVHHPKALKKFVGRYNDFKIKALHTLGNHETDGSTYEEVLEAYRLACGHYFYDVNGFRFVICDNNYYKFPDGHVEHYSHAHGDGGKVKGVKLGWMPEEQVEWLRETLERSPYPCVICSHYSFERERRSVPNYQAVRDVINEANRRHPGRVRLVMNGHEHIDNLRVLDNVLYFDFNSANYQYYAKKHDRYPPEYMKAHSQGPHCIAWDAPLSAIITMTAAGRIRIDGSRANWLYGVTPVDAGYTPFEWDGTGRITHPVVQSADMTFNFQV